MASAQTTSEKTVLNSSDKTILGSGAALVIVAGLAHYGHWNTGVAFVCSAGAIAIA